METIIRFVKRNSKTISTCTSLVYSLLTIFVCLKYGWSSEVAHKLSAYILLGGYSLDLLIPGQKLETKLHHSLGLIVIVFFIRMFGTVQYYKTKPIVKYFLYLEVTNIFNNYRSLSTWYKPKYKQLTQMMFALTFLTIRPYCFYQAEKYFYKNPLPIQIKYFVRGILFLNLYWMVLIIKIFCIKLRKNNILLINKYKKTK